MENEIINLKIEIEQLKKRNNDLEEHLKKYTAPIRSKTFYQNHKEEIKQKTHLEGGFYFILLKVRTQIVDVLVTNQNLSIHLNHSITFDLHPQKSL